MSHISLLSILTQRRCYSLFCASSPCLCTGPIRSTHLDRDDHRNALPMRDNRSARGNVKVQPCGVPTKDGCKMSDWLAAGVATFKWWCATALESGVSQSQRRKVDQGYCVDALKSATNATRIRVGDVVHHCTGLSLPSDPTYTCLQSYINRGRGGQSDYRLIISR